jgi:hypothetical protein
VVTMLLVLIRDIYLLRIKVFIAANFGWCTQYEVSHSVRQSIT